MRGHGESQAHIHARWNSVLPVYREIFSTSAKALRISSNLRLTSGLAHPEDGAVEKNIFASGQFGMKSRADFQQACHAATQLDPAR